MKKLINIYCDETCHLESTQITEKNRFMVLGGISCPDDMKQEIFQTIKRLKGENRLRPFSEVKWTKIAKAKLSAYQALVRYFFECEALSFRAVIIDKTQLKHHQFNHTHDEFYYKMYWQMLEWFIEPANCYQIYLDIKDTQGYLKVKKLHEVLCNSQHDFDRETIKKIQEIRSHENVLVQLADILIGAISHANRYLNTDSSNAKQEIVSLIKELSGFSLVRSTSLGARKFNLFHWEGQ